MRSAVIASKSPPAASTSSRASATMSASRSGLGSAASRSAVSTAGRTGAALRRTEGSSPDREARVTRPWWPKARRAISTSVAIMPEPMTAISASCGTSASASRRGYGSSM